MHAPKHEMSATYVQEEARGIDLNSDVWVSKKEVVAEVVCVYKRR
jgi:hypothetical protein